MLKVPIRFTRIVRFTTAVATVVVALLPAMPAYSGVGNIHSGAQTAQVAAEQGGVDPSEPVHL